MGRFHLNKLPKKKRIQMIGEFYDAIDFLKNRQEVRLFLKDLLSGDEIANLMRRIEVAVLLKSGFNYEQIVDILGVGKNKINNVQRVLMGEGGGEGYKLVIKRLLEDRKRRIKKQKKIEKVQKSTFEKLKHQYSGHFLLFNLIDELSEKLEEDDSLVTKEAALHTPSFVPFKNDSFKDNKKDNKKNNKNKNNKNKD